jgi:hypothetical protein
MESRMFDLPLPLRPVIELKDSSLEKSQRVLQTTTSTVNPGKQETDEGKDRNVPS